ncbi:MAG: hypothetical protein EU532_08880, partial [Promethearchaeota archaeon]
YKKLYDLKERYSFLRNNFPRYLFFSKELDLELQGVLNDDIKKIYSPREYFKKLREKNTLTPLEKYSKELCELFIKDGNLPENSIGITGSSMVNLAKEDSDIDLIIYGTENSLQFQEKLKSIFNKSNNCNPYNLDEFKAHYNWRAGGSGITFNDFLKSEKRKLHQGKFFGLDFFIRYIKSPKDWKDNYYDYKYKNCGRIKFKAEVTDSINSIFTPCSYKIHVIDLLENSQIYSKIDLSRLREINSFRGRFCEQALKGEKVIVEGKLEKVFYKDTEEYYRILLEDQVSDKMIIL